MGAVFSLPCFRRQRRRRPDPHPPARTISISHPRPLGSVLPLSASVSSGPSGTGGLASAARSLASDAASTTRSQSNGRRGFTGIGFTQFVTLGSIDDSTNNVTSRPAKRPLEMSDLGHGSDDTHASSSPADPLIPPRTRPRGASTTSSCALLRDPSHASRSASGRESHRAAARSPSSRSRGQKRTNSYSRSTRRSGRSRPLSHPASHGVSGSIGCSDGVALSTSTDSLHSLSATARRRALRKIRRVDNGWDYIQSVDLDGFDEKLGMNGKRRIIVV